MRCRRMCGSVVLTALSLALNGIAAPAFPADESERFVAAGRVLDGAADWVSSDQDRLVFGSGNRVTIAALRPSLRLDAEWNLERPASDGLVIGSNLYLVWQGESGSELAVADLSAAVPSPRPIPLEPTPRGLIRIAQMDDYLLVAEDGLGVRILQLPGHQHAGHPGHDAGEPAAIGLLAFEEPIQSLAVTLRTIYLTTEKHLIEIEANVPSLPTLVRRIPLERSAHALAANNDTVYLLGDDGLRTLDVSQSGMSPTVTLDSGVRGNSLQVLGRTIYVGADIAGLQRFEDASPRMATFFVAVGDVFFSPAGALNVTVQDTVVWQKPGTIFMHNVFSCNAVQLGCGGQTSTEVFTAGAPTTLAFNFSHRFTMVGNNPYLCQVHTLTMTGNIIVSAAGPAPPPGVPDGGGALSPMRVSKLNAGGVNLGILFDTSCPDAVNHDLIFGNRAALPVVLGGTYAPAGSQCGVGASPFNWIATPAAPAGDFVWWLLVADDGVSVEGSWGQDGAAGVGGAERSGAGANGSSGLCGNLNKDLTNTCGQ